MHDMEAWDNSIETETKLPVASVSTPQMGNGIPLCREK